MVDYWIPAFAGMTAVDNRCGRIPRSSLRDSGGGIPTVVGFHGVSSSVMFFIVQAVARAHPHGAPHGAPSPVGSVMRATVPWPGSELTFTPPSYFFTRCPTTVSPSPIAPSRVV